MRRRISYILLWSGILLFLLQNMRDADTYLEVLLTFMKEQWPIFLIIFAILLSKEKSTKIRKHK